MGVSYLLNCKLGFDHPLVTWQYFHPPCMYQVYARSSPVFHGHTFVCTFSLQIINWMQSRFNNGKQEKRRSEAGVANSARGE